MEIVVILQLEKVIYVAKHTKVKACLKEQDVDKGSKVVVVVVLNTHVLSLEHFKWSHIH